MIKKLWQPRSIKLVNLLLKIYDQSRPVDIRENDVMISRNIAFERDKRLKKRCIKRVQLFSALKNFI